MVLGDRDPVVALVFFRFLRLTRDLPSRHEAARYRLLTIENGAHHGAGEQDRICLLAEWHARFRRLRQGGDAALAGGLLFLAGAVPLEIRVTVETAG
ncbi:hypothetical protein D9M68_832820 [compost metagenome]